MSGLGGQLALVTGGSKGIGAAVATALRDLGATVIRVGRSLPASAPAGGHHVVADLGTDAGLDAVEREVIRIGLPDLIVGSAGAFALGELGAVGTEALDLLYRVNLRAPYDLARRFLPRMRARGRGRHVLIGSIADHVAIPGNAAYAATKFGLRGLHQVLRAECRGSGVLCTLVSPGPVDTPLWDPFEPDRRADLPSRAAMLKPAEVAEAVAWVATRPPTVDVDLIRLGPP